jgi:hypothetical protein
MNQKNNRSSGYFVKILQERLRYLKSQATIRGKGRNESLRREISALNYALIAITERDHIEGVSPNLLLTYRLSNANFRKLDG